MRPAHAFTPGEEESVMIGKAARLAIDVPLPDGVTLRRITAEADIRRMCAMQSHVFGSPTHAEKLLIELAEAPSIECWIAEAGSADTRTADGSADAETAASPAGESGTTAHDETVSAGRLHPVPNTEVAGIWGGATLPQWRGRGIYRALTAARARSALRSGRVLIHSDSTPYSRPILERYGFVTVTTTTPWELRRTAGT